MTHLSLDGHIREVAPDALVIWSLGIMISPLDLVGILHWAQYFAMPGKFAGEALQIINKSAQQLEANTKILDDLPIRYAVNLVLPSLETFALTASEIREWQGKHVSRKMRADHNQATKLAGPRIPAWHDDEEFQTMFRKSSAAFSLYLDALDETIPIIRKSFPPAAPESWSLQLDHASKQLLDIRLMLRLGYEETVRRKAAEIGYLPRA